MRDYLRARKTRLLEEIARFKAEHQDVVWFSPGTKSTAKSAQGCVEFAESKLAKIDYLLEHGAIGRADQVCDQASEAFKKAKRLLKNANAREDTFRTEVTAEVQES